MKNVKKYRKLLQGLQSWVWNKKKMNPKPVYCSGNHYWFECENGDVYQRKVSPEAAGYIMGRQSAFSDVSRQLHKMIQNANEDWDLMQVRDGIWEQCDDTVAYQCRCTQSFKPYIKGNNYWFIVVGTGGAWILDSSLNSGYLMSKAKFHRYFCPIGEMFNNKN